MIFGIGTDIVSVSRMRLALEKHGERFAQRILNDDEWPQFTASKQQANFLAKRFAAKEAAAKALGTGFRDGLAMRHIGVSHDSKGKPLLVFTDRAAEFIDECQIGESFLSLSDEREHAIAFVTLLKQK